jgi:catechol 2,3-dioxygenase-like lactoylglutathione lyase family enzyme
MAVRLDHTIVFAKDAERSAEFFADILGLPAPKRVYHFSVVQTDDGVSFDFASTDEPIRSQHYAFHVSDEEWDASFAKIKDRGIAFWADPSQRRPGQVATDGGGRRIYFEDLAGHYLEIFTVP